MKNLPTITLIAVDCTDRIKGTIQAMLFSMLKINFGEAKLLSHEKPNCLPPEIEFEKIDKITNIDEYSKFVFLDLGKHIETSHCLMVQDHGYVISPEMWVNEWLDLDYLGCAWAVVPNTYMANNGERVRNGNGGFSLRSKKLLDLPKKMGWYLREEQGWKNEDGNVTCYWRKEMLEQGINYGSLADAVDFGYEKPMMENNYGRKKFFGFHRNFPLGIRDE